MIFISNDDKNNLSTLYFPKTTSLIGESPVLKIWSEIDLKEYTYYVGTFTIDILTQTEGVNNINENDVVVFEAASTTNNYGYYIQEVDEDNIHYVVWKQGLNPNCIWKLINVIANDGYITCNIQNYNSGWFLASSIYQSVYNKNRITQLIENNTYMINIRNKDVGVNWTTYDSQVDNPKGWNNDCITLIEKSEDSRNWQYRAFANDISFKSIGSFNNTGSHNIQWKMYKVNDINSIITSQSTYYDYYVFNINLSNLNSGEYRYTLTSSNTIIESGLLNINSSSNSPTSFSKSIDKYEYTQYNG